MESLSQLTFLFHMVAVMSADALDPSATESCVTPQYLPIGQMGIVECSFQNFYSVFWYNSTDSENDTPLAALKASSKSGDGYLSGQFDIFSNGSLLINHVTLQNDHYFRVIMLRNKDGDDYVIRNIRVYVVVIAEQPYPFTETCKEQFFCFLQLNQNDELHCVVSETRPAANLTWMARYGSGDQDVLSEDVVLKSNERYVSKTKMFINFTESVSMVLFVCKVLGPPGVISVPESMVFIENIDKKYHITEKEQKNIKIGSKLTLVCSQRSKLFTMWKKTNEFGNWVTITYIYFGEEVYSKVYSPDYKLEPDGSLTVSRVEIDTEGLYMCINNDDEGEVVKTFEVLVFILPESPSVIIEGCNPDERCVLNVHSTGNLTCSVKGIRPKVELQWFTLPEKDAKYISFFEHKESTTMNGDTYDITVTSQYKLVDGTQTRLAVECRVSGWYIAVSALDQNIELQFLSEHITASSGWIIPVVLIILALIVVAVIFLVRKCKGEAKSSKLNRSTNQNTQLVDATDIEIDPDISHKEHTSSPGKGEDTPLIRISEAPQDPIRLFKKSLKSNYKEMCEVLRFPCLSDEKTCVDNIFVERSFQSRPLEEPSDHNLWIEMDSHHEIFHKAFTSSSRVILAGDHGTGKRSLCLQMAYEWCEQRDPLSNYETLLMLNVEDLINFKSFYAGVKELLSLEPISEESIKDILESFSTGLIIFYKVDFLNNKQKKHSDFAKILSGKLLPKFHFVFVATPQQIPEKLKRKEFIVYLKDIDDKFQQKYIRKIYPNRNILLEEINTKLEENPFLGELCKIPLFWTIYVYISHSSKNYPISAAAVLREMVSILEDDSDETEEAEEKFLKSEGILAKKAFEIASEKRHSWGLDELPSDRKKSVCDHFEHTGFIVAGPDGKRSFCHKILCDYYAACHIANSEVACVETLLNQVSFTDFKRVFCFVCGVNPDYGGHVFKVLKKTKNCPRELMINCLFEFKHGGGSIETDFLKKVFDRRVTLKQDDTKLDQDSAVKLLKIATNFTQHIGIDTLSLKDCLQIDGCSDSCLKLQSGSEIPSLKFITKMEIEMEGKIMTDIHPLLKYAASCKKLVDLHFESCFLPETIRTEDIATAQREFNVHWNPQLKGHFLKFNSTRHTWDDKFSEEKLSHDAYKELKKLFLQKYGE